MCILHKTHTMKEIIESLKGKRVYIELVKGVLIRVSINQIRESFNFIQKQVDENIEVIKIAETKDSVLIKITRNETT